MLRGWLLAALKNSSNHVYPLNHGHSSTRSSSGTGHLLSPRPAPRHWRNRSEGDFSFMAGPWHRTVPAPSLGAVARGGSRWGSGGMRERPGQGGPSGDSCVSSPQPALGYRSITEPHQGSQSGAGGRTGVLCGLDRDRAAWVEGISRRQRGRELQASGQRVSFRKSWAAPATSRRLREPLLASWGPPACPVRPCVCFN